MPRRKPELQSLDLNAWPSIAWTELDAEVREVTKVRVQAIERYASGESVTGGWRHSPERAAALR